MMRIFVSMREGSSQELTWCLGQDRSDIDRVRWSENATVTKVVIDGKELDWVRHTFTNLPSLTNTTVSPVAWVGDQAGFIIANL